jgi:hypothetical protein
MHRIAIAMSLLSLFGATVHSQEPPRPLLHAGQCLTLKNFLPSTKATNLTFGYFIDEKSYPGDKVLYVVLFATPHRTNGFVFTIFVTDRQGTQTFDIQNNASFHLSKTEPGGVTFKTPPLGGVWTQQHLASAITQIERQPRFAITTKDLSMVESSVRCESYADPQVK